MTERSEKMNRWSTFKLGQDVNVLVAGTIVGRVRRTGMYVVATTDGRETEVHPYDLRFDPDGRFDPFKAGLGAPQAQPPTWEEARSHAEALLAQGVRVQISERMKWIEIRDCNGELHDPDDGTPASRGFYPDGAPRWISHWTNGKRHDPADGTPEIQEFYPDGAPRWKRHYTNGKLISEERFPPPIGET